MNERHLNKNNLMVIVSVAILVGTEILAAALALGWAVGGLFAIGQTATLMLIALCLLVGAWLIYLFVRRALRIEPLYSSAPPSKA